MRVCGRLLSVPCVSAIRVRADVCSVCGRKQVCVWWWCVGCDVAVNGHKKQMSRADYASEIHRRVQRPKQTRRVQVRGIDNTWTSDETGPIADPTKANRGYKYLLLVMDVFSRTATSILNKHVRS